MLYTRKKYTARWSVIFSKFEKRMEIFVVCRNSLFLTKSNKPIVNDENDLRGIVS